MERIMILLILAGISGVHSQTDMDCKSFIFHRNYSMPAQFLYSGDGPKFTFTVCLRACTKMTESVMFSLIGGLPSEYLFLVLGSGPDSNAGLIWLDGQKEDVNFPTDKRRQRSLCLSWDSANGKLNLWVNGKISMNRDYPKRDIYYESPSIYMGPGQIFLGGRPRLEVGEVTDLHVWDRVLGSQDVADFHDRKEASGNVINWRSLEYKRADGDFTVGRFKCKAKSYH